MTCPFCGAANVEYHSHTGFECGSWTVCNNFEQSAACRELCQLREKKAQGLDWNINETTRGRCAIGVDGIYWIADARNGFDLRRNDYLVSGFYTLDAAKAHAEELHQQAWRELRERWDAK